MPSSLKMYLQCGEKEKRGNFLTIRNKDLQFCHKWRIRREVLMLSFPINWSTVWSTAATHLTMPILPIFRFMCASYIYCQVLSLHLRFFNPELAKKISSEVYIANHVGLSFVLTSEIIWSLVLQYSCSVYMYILTGHFICYTLLVQGWTALLLCDLMYCCCSLQQ